jgi:hypothetical protein
MKRLIRWSTRIAAALVTGSLALTVNTGAVASAKTSTTETVSLHVLPVGPCASVFGAGGPSTGPAWEPTKLAAAMPDASAGKLEFYSVGTERFLGTLETLLGPRGWSCGQLTGADGAAEMAVYPPGSANPFSLEAPSEPAPGEQLVEASFDYTGHIPGIDRACPYFPSVASASGAPCPSTVPTGEKVTRLTADVVAITDPPAVKGSLAGSGGRRSVTGLMIVPEGSNLPDSVGVAKISCSLRAASLCSTILSDFVVRQFPIPTYPPA